MTSAAGLTLLLIGAWWGRSSLPEATGDRPRFVLFLLEDSLFLGTRAVGHDSLVAEYTGWASGLAQQGHLVLGEELDESSRVLGMAAATDATSLDVITGLFVLSAANLDEAMTLARTSPHLRYGGGILVRPVLRGGSPAR